MDKTFICAFKVANEREYNVIIRALVDMGFEKGFTSNYSNCIAAISTKRTGKIGYSGTSGYYEAEGVPLYTYRDIVGDGHD